MSENKSSLHSTNAHSNKYMASNQTTKHRTYHQYLEKGIKSRGSFAKHDENNHTARNPNAGLNADLHNGSSLLAERCLNLPEQTSGYSSYRNSLE